MYSVSLLYIKNIEKVNLRNQLIYLTHIVKAKFNSCQPHSERKFVHPIHGYQTHHERNNAQSDHVIGFSFIYDMDNRLT